MDKQKKPATRLYLRIFLYLLGFCVLMLLLLWLFLTVFLEQFYKSIKLREVEAQAQVLAGYLQEGDYTALENAVRQRGDVYLEVLGPDGTSYTLQNHFPEGGPSTFSAAEKQQMFADIKAEGTGFLQRKEPPQQAPESNGWQKPLRPESIMYVQLVQTSTEGEKLLLINASITPVNATVQTIRVLLLCISGIMLVVAVGLALLMARHVARPISRLNRAARLFGQGSYTPPPAHRGAYREIEELSATLGHAANELAKTESLRRELIANVSHDLRTPLTLITGYAEMMRDIPGENCPENMEVIIGEGRRLSSLVDDLLELSRLEAGTLEMQLECFSLTAETEAILTRFSKFSQPEGFRLRFEKEGEAFVQGDAARLSRVLYNFLTNAMHHSHSREKKITVRQTIAEGRVKLEVADAGEGIPPESLPYIWDRYYKAGKAGPKAGSGSGLGLSIAKNILQKHPGALYGAQSTPGTGSVFWFSLPVSKPNGPGEMDKEKGR